MLGCKNQLSAPKTMQGKSSLTYLDMFLFYLWQEADSEQVMGYKDHGTRSWYATVMSGKTSQRRKRLELNL